MSGPAAAGARLSPPPAIGFLLRAALWFVALFGLLRLPWIQSRLLVPFAEAQHGFACALTGAPRDAVVIDLSCTGSDALALTLGAVLAFPAPWRRRLTGAALGFAVVTLLNTLRIGSLSFAVGQPRLFQALHVYVWPALLIVAAAGYVFWWMRRIDADRRPAATAPAMRFAALGLLLVALYFALTPWLLSSEALLAVARGAAAAAGLVMRAVGVEARVAGNLLTSPSGSWVITPECVATPLIPVYLAAVLAFGGTPWRRALAAVAAVPLFLALASARLLVLALPQAVVGSHLVAVHAFHQVLAAGVAVAAAARLGGGAAWGSDLRRAGGALAIGAAVGLPLAAAARRWLEPSLPWTDPQGALVLLPAFQLGLLAALLWALGRPLTPRRLAQAGALGVAAAVFTLGAVVWLAGRSLPPPVVAIRAAALAAPLVLAAWLVRDASPWRRGAASGAGG